MARSGLVRTEVPVRRSQRVVRTEVPAVEAEQEKGVRCVQKNTFLHFVVESPSMRRPRCSSDVTYLRAHNSKLRAQSEEEDDIEALSTATIDEESPMSIRRSRLESLDEWCGQETPEFNACFTPTVADPDRFFLPRGAAAAQQMPHASAARPQTAPAPQETRPREAPSKRSDVTIMLRNIPNKYTQDALLVELAEHLFFIDFFYLPIDFRNQCNLGYAFLNFKDGSAATRFQNMFDGNRLARFPQSPKVLAVHLARVQGLQQNVKRLRNSSVMGVLTDDCKPLLFEDGEAKLLPIGPPANSRRVPRGGRNLR